MVFDVFRCLDCNGRVYEGHKGLIYYILGSSGAETGLEWAENRYFDVVWRICGLWECLWRDFRCVWVSRMR